MDVVNRQMIVPITYNGNPIAIRRNNSSGLGDPITDAVGSVVTGLIHLFSGTPHPWINAQNQTESNIAAIVASYVAVKNAGQLTAAYINNAIVQVQAQSDGFAKYIQQYSGTSGSEYAAAQKGSGDIASNANAVIANMRMDLAKLPVATVPSVISGIFATTTPPTTITNPDGTVTVIPGSPSVASSSNLLALGAAFFILPKLFR